MHQLRIGNLWRYPLGDTKTTPLDEYISVGLKEFVQHRGSLTLSFQKFGAVPYIGLPSLGIYFSPL